MTMLGSRDVIHGRLASFLCMMLYTIMISVITVIQIHIQRQADSFVSDTNGFINSWLQSMVTRREKHNS